jgi:hypothetical protein
MVTGLGFPVGGKARCRFGIPTNYAIVEGKVLSKKIKCTQNIR